MDQLIVHFAIDGNIILKTSDEANDQDEYWHQKDQEEKSILATVNKGILDDKYKDYRLEGEEKEREK